MQKCGLYNHCFVILTIYNQLFIHCHLIQNDLLNNPGNQQLLNKSTTKNQTYRSNESFEQLCDLSLRYIFFNILLQSDVIHTTWMVIITFSIEKKYSWEDHQSIGVTAITHNINIVTRNSLRTMCL